MQYSRKVIWGTLLVSSLLILVGLLNVFLEDSTGAKILGVIFIFLGAAILFYGFKFRESKRFGVILLLMFPIFFVFGLINVLIMEKGTSGQISAGMIVPGLISLFCLWKAYKLWNSEKYENASQIERSPVNGKAAVTDNDLKKINIGIPLLLCIGSICTFIIGLIQKDNDFFKWGLIGFVAGGWMTFQAYRKNSSKKQGKEEIISNVEKVGSLNPISNDLKYQEKGGPELTKETKKDTDDSYSLESIKNCNEEKKLIAAAECSDDPDVRLAAMEKLIENPVFPKLVEKEIIRTKGKIHVGMRLSEVINILGSPTDSIGGNQTIKMTASMGAQIPKSMNQLMGDKEFYQWDRPEGYYKLVVENGIVTNKFSVPEGI